MKTVGCGNQYTELKADFETSEPGALHPAGTVIPGAGFRDFAVGVIQ